MPNYKPKMHMKYDVDVLTLGKWKLWMAQCGHEFLSDRIIGDWSKVTCGNCLRCKPKG